MMLQQARGERRLEAFGRQLARGEGVAQLRHLHASDARRAQLGHSRLGRLSPHGRLGRRRLEGGGLGRGEPRVGGCPAAWFGLHCRRPPLRPGTGGLPRGGGGGRGIGGARGSPDSVALLGDGGAARLELALRLVVVEEPSLHLARVEPLLHPRALVDVEELDGFCLSRGGGGERPRRRSGRRLGARAPIPLERRGSLRERRVAVRWVGPVGAVHGGAWAERLLVPQRLLVVLLKLVVQLKLGPFELLLEARPARADDLLLLHKEAGERAAFGVAGRAVLGPLRPPANDTRLGARGRSQQRSREERPRLHREEERQEPPLQRRREHAPARPTPPH
eukprot:scaffold5924_cov48-Phaeocystis_antarctica.AAC.1